MTLAQGQILNNRYRIVSLLGEGGFGAVYKAWDTKLNGPCALKENYGVTPEAERQFAQEATILFNLRHPGLPMVFDYFSLPGQGQYLVMVFIEGMDLQELLDAASDPLPEAKVVPWIEQVCDALSYLHSQNPPIIHRDIKPANIKITPQGQAVLVDFGIAKVYDPKLKTTVGARAVTPGFSPPEQYGRGRTDPRTDIYALGATLYALLTKVEPPDSVDLLAGNEPPPTPPINLNPRISLILNKAITKSMQLDRKHRFQTAQDFKAGLSPIPEPLHPPKAVQSAAPTIQAAPPHQPEDKTKAKLPKQAGSKVPGELHQKPDQHKKPWLIPLILIPGILLLVFLLYLVAPIREQVDNLLWGLNNAVTGSSEQDVPLMDRPLDIPRFDVPIDDNPVMGDWDAPITLAMFGDYADDQSRGWYLEIWPRLRDAYGEQVRLVYLDFPQERIHPDSFSAALAANCAREQERFWEYHDKLYVFDLGLGPGAYYGYAEELRLDLEGFRECLERERYLDVVIRDVEAAQSLNIKRAPAFFINGIRVEGIEPYDVFANIIERELGWRP